MTFLNNLARWYATSSVLLLTHALCICIGAAWMYFAVKGVLEVQGIL